MQDQTVRHPLRGRRLAPLAVLLALGTAVVVLTGNGHGDRQRPREVTARGDLTPGERANIALFERASPSVVHITTTARVQESIFSRNLVEVEQGTGSGFVWDADGHVVTNFHVVRGIVRVDSTGSRFEQIPGVRAFVTVSNKAVVPAQVVGVAPHKDLAVLKLEGGVDLPALDVGRSSDLRVGQMVYAIGNPFGLDQTLTTGIISGLGREIQAVDGTPIEGVIQTDAAINPGNSGGPLLDSSGRLIGVNTAIVSPSGAYAGIGFAVPVDAVNRIVPELIEYGHAVRAGFGIAIASDNVARAYGLRGVIIRGVAEGSAASRAGFQPWRVDENNRVREGDVIVGVGDRGTPTSEHLFSELKKYDVGEVVRVVLERDGRRREVEVKLQALE